jgi:4-hydroxy-tetrahydrodipicolinate synthase
MSSTFPRPFVALRDALRSGDEQAAAAAQDGVKQVAGATGNVALLKAALALRGLPAGPPRVAVDPPTPAQLDTLRAAIDDVG